MAAIVLIEGCVTPCGPRCNRGPAEAPQEATAPETDPEARRLLDLADAWWEHLMVTSPTWATYLGDRRFDDRLEDISTEAREAHLEVARRVLDQLHTIDREALRRARDAVTWDVLNAVLRRTLAQEVCRGEQWSVDQLYGLQVRLPGLANSHTIRDTRDVETLASRYGAAATLVDQHIANLEAGLAAGRVAFHVAVSRVIGQIENLVKTPKTSSPFVAGVRFPDAWNDARQAMARVKLARAVDMSVYPALERYAAFLRDRYLSVARQTPGVSTLPEGRACYAHRIRAQTGSTESPEAIHQIGLDELARLEAEMMAIARSLGTSEDLRTFVAQLRSRPDQVATSEAALLAVAKDAVARAQAALPGAFGKLPATPIIVKPIEAYRAASAPAAYYYSAPADGSRPAVFYLNTHQVQERLLYNQEALAFHEAVPGHHLQIALAAEIDDIPTFQRRQSQTAFVEGWGLYAELLADELGLYASPLGRFGMLNYQAWRACRLVVDTGIHALGWSREQAITFMVGHTALTRSEVEVEIDRYIIWPGQALAYMLGRMGFQRLRAKAETALGDRFDLR
ncbi:MAG: DUF885 domain-containing protein, partial [Myxococcota bacterium]|nr:DUF885 domain-containing protein [Myxococcota bacterium]